jgi:hypothetical protein
METPWEYFLQTHKSAKDESLGEIEDLFQKAEAIGNNQS